MGELGTQASIQHIAGEIGGEVRFGRIGFRIGSVRIVRVKKVDEAEEWPLRGFNLLKEERKQTFCRIVKTETVPQSGAISEKGQPRINLSDLAQRIGRTAADCWAYFIEPTERCERRHRVRIEQSVADRAERVVAGETKLIGQAVLWSVIFRAQPAREPG